jgi:hypothetical protein
MPPPERTDTTLSFNEGEIAPPRRDRLQAISTHYLIIRIGPEAKLGQIAQPGAQLSPQRNFRSAQPGSVPNPGRAARKHRQRNDPLGAISHHKAIGDETSASGRER